MGVCLFVLSYILHHVSEYRSAFLMATVPELEYEQFNLTIGSVIGYCWTNLTPRIVWEILWMVGQLFYAFCRGLEKVLWTLSYLYINYIDRLLAYIAVHVIGIEINATLAQNVTNCTLFVPT